MQVASKIVYESEVLKHCQQGDLTPVKQIHLGMQDHLFSAHIFPFSRDPKFTRSNLHFQISAKQT